MLKNLQSYYDAKFALELEIKEILEGITIGNFLPKGKHHFYDNLFIYVGDVINNGYWDIQEFTIIPDNGSSPTIRGHFKFNANGNLELNSQI